MIGNDDDVQAATDNVIRAAETLAERLRHSSRNLEAATGLLLMLLSDDDPAAQGHADE